MNLPPEKFKRIAGNELRRFAAVCLKTAGLRHDHAEQLAGLLANGDLRGVRSHGTRLLTGYCRSLRRKRINPDPILTVLRETDTSVLVDGDGGLGYAPMMMATELAISKAAEKGVAAGGSCHIGHYGSAGHYVRRAMEEGCTAFSVQGSLERFAASPTEERPSAADWGNPPFCFGLPSRDEAPIVVDGGTNVMIDCGDERLQELVPAAFFKSMGLTAVSRMLGGPLVGVNSPQAERSNRRWPDSGKGGLIIVLDLGLFAPSEDFRTAVDDLVRGVGAHMAPIKGYSQTTLPGAIEAAREEKYRRLGVPVGIEDLRQLNRLAEELGIEFPDESKTD